MIHLEPIEHEYFNWLIAKIKRRPTSWTTPSQSYWKLMRELQNTEFVWIVPMDDNRAEDGLELRREFVRENQLTVDPDWMHIGCSVLEMLVAFARRADFATDRGTRDWFWEFLINLGLSEFNDSVFIDNYHNLTVAERLNTFIWRTYEYNGFGGMFPIRDARHDQRKVEIWYQFCEYLIAQE